MTHPFTKEAVQHYDSRNGVTFMGHRPVGTISYTSPSLICTCEICKVMRCWLEYNVCPSCRRPYYASN
jgi:hypothetical protein